MNHAPALGAVPDSVVTLWRLPKERLGLKRRKKAAKPSKRKVTGPIAPPSLEDHVVPLTPALVKLLGGPTNGKYLFTTTGDKPFSGYSKAKRTLVETIAKIREEEGRPPMPHWQLHDLRRTAKSLIMAEGGPALGEASERVMGHVIPGVEGTYDRYQYIKEKHEALMLLERRLDRILWNEAHPILVADYDMAS